MSFPDATGPPGVRRPRAGTEQAGPTRFVVPGDVAGGALGLFETTAAPGAMAAIPHFHRGFSESFYVLSGRLGILTGRQWWTAGSGDAAHVPPDGVHAFGAVGDEEARFLILFVPGAPRERYFRGLAEFARRDVPPSPAEVDAFAATCDQINVRDWESPPPPSQ